MIDNELDLSFRGSYNSMTYQWAGAVIGEDAWANALERRKKASCDLLMDLEHTRCTSESMLYGALPVAARRL